MSEFINSDVYDMNIELISSNVFEESCTPLSDTRCDNKSLHAASMVGLGPRHQGSNSSDVSGVAGDSSPSEGGRDGTSLNVGNDIVGKQPEHSGQGPHDACEVVRVNPLGKVFELRNTSPDVAQDMSYRTERAKITVNYRDPTVPAFERRNESSTRQSRRQAASDKRRTSETSCSDNSKNTLYTLVNGVTGHDDGNIRLTTLPSLDAPFELDEMPDGKFSQALQAGDLSD